MPHLLLTYLPKHATIFISKRLAHRIVSQHITLLNYEPSCYKIVVCILSSFQHVCTYCDFLCVQKYEVLVNYAQFLLTRALTSTLTRSSFCIVIERTLNSSQTLFKTKSFERKNFVKLHSKLRGWSLLSRNFILAPKS